MLSFLLFIGAILITFVVCIVSASKPKKRTIRCPVCFAESPPVIKGNTVHYSAFMKRHLESCVNGRIGKRVL